MSSESLRVERTGPPAVGRPRDALPGRTSTTRSTPSLIAELRTTFAGARARGARRELRAVVLAGDGPSFCAGADIAWMRAAMALDVEGNEQDAMAMADMFETIDTCPVPVIARVHGAALGGGMGLAPSPTSSSPRPARGSGSPRRASASCPRSSAPFVIAKIGETHARALFPGGRRFDAVRAQRIGLVHEVVEGEAALDAAVDAAVADILAAGPTAARAAKAIVREVRGLGHGSSKWHTARVIARQRVSDEAQEGFRAFTEKRRRPGRRTTTRTSTDAAQRLRAFCDMRQSRHDGRRAESEPGGARIGATTRSVQRWIASRSAAGATRRRSMACRV